MSDFHFLRPHALVLIPFLLFLFFFLHRHRPSKIWNHVCSKELLPYILAKRTKRFYLPSFLIFLIGSLLITALAGPSWQLIEHPFIQSQSGLVIALDLSPSMNVEDIKPSRLQRAIYKINDILTLRKEGQTALIVFSGDAFVVTPLTDDVATIKALLPVLETKMMPSSGHHVDKAIIKGTELLTQAGISNGTILLITPELSNQEMEKSINSALQQGVSISVLGVGTEENIPIPNSEGGFIKDEKGALVLSRLSKENLNRLANLTQGAYVTLTVDDRDVQALTAGFSIFDPSHSQKQSEFKQNKWHDQGYLLVLFSLPFVLLLCRRGGLILALFLMPHTLQAFSWNDLWKTPDQQAEQLFHQENYQQAKDLFHHPNWQAAANFKLGNYEEAANLFQGNQTAEGYYNLGTAKAKQGDFDSALEAYTNALEIQPNHEDALYNKKIIEELRQQEKQKKQDQNDQNQESEKEQKQNPDKKQDEQNTQEKDQDQNPAKENKETKQQGQEEQIEDQNHLEKNEKKESESQDQYRDQVKENLQENEEKPTKEQIVQEEKPSDQDPQRQIDERWLQRIEDDPGGLLRRKFLLQYQQQHQTKHQKMDKK